MLGPTVYGWSDESKPALRKLKRKSESKSPYVFVSERGAPLSVSAFQKLINRAGKAAGFDF
jgi:type 1 fimbriae regulatory protein FimB/type 1 fimbriae regulatory protein FimE